MDAFLPRDVHCLWLVSKWRSNLSRQDLSICAREVFGVSVPDEEVEKILDVGVQLGLVDARRDAWALTTEGRRFATLSHWRAWEPNKPAQEVLRRSSLDALFIGKLSFERPIVIDLFAGAGGLGLGFESAGYRVAVAVDNDPQACAAHRKNFPDCKVVEDSIEQIAKNPSGLLCTSFGISPTEVTGVIGGPPCQGFSFMGERIVDDERNLLTSRFADVVLDIEPSFFVMENVQGLLSIGAVPDFSEYVVRAGKSIGTHATAIVHRLPAIPKARAQRDRQFRKKLISRAITAAKMKIADIAVGLSSTSKFGRALEESVVVLFDEFTRRCRESFDEGQRSTISDILRDSDDDLTMIALGSLVEAMINAGIISPSTCEQQLKEGVPSIKGKRKKLIVSLLESYDAAPPSMNYRGVRIGPILSRLIKRLSTKYRVAPPSLLSSAWYGAPQDRRRLFLVGIHRRHDSEFEFPLPEFDIPGKDTIGTLLDLPPAPTCSQAIGDLPDIDRFDFLIESDELPSKKLRKAVTEFQQLARLEMIKPEDLSVCRPDWNPFFTNCCLRTLHKEHVLDRLRETELGKQDETSHKTRLHPNRVSHTLRAGTREKMGSHTAVRPIHYAYHRVISVREGARLMGFPDWMTFHKTKWHGFRLVGNGVPMHLGRAIASTIRDLLQRDTAREAAIPSYAASTGSLAATTGSAS